MANPITIYGGHPFYALTQAIVDDIKSSGFTTVMGWILHVEANGDLQLNSNPLISNGKYVGDSTWPGLMADFTTGNTSVTKIGFSIGGWTSPDFANIENLIKQQGTGPTSILYKNFSALQKTVPNLSLIDYDDEGNYDQNSTVKFSEMLYNDFKLNVTFCPFENSPYWMDCLHALNTQTPGLVLGLNLQCYSGGAGNDPSDWISAIENKMGISSADATAMVWPGLEPMHGGQKCDGVGVTPAQMETQFNTWYQTNPISGGFVYLYDFIVGCQSTNGYSAADYAKAIEQGLS